MQAFDLIHDWYGSNPDMPFVLRGYAGTGKTFLVQRVIQSFQDCLYGYAITVHQSQGGTFTNCFVDTSNIFGCRDNVMRNKLLYVAYSRASQQLYCYSKW